MSLNKPYIKKPLVHSPRDKEVLESLSGYLVQVTRASAPGATPVRMEARIKSPGQCIAALRAAKKANARCLVYALGEVFGTECQALVDEDFLLAKMYGTGSSPEPIIEGDASFLAGLRRGST